MSISVGILGASGYTGLELLRLLHAHPEADIVIASSRQHEGQLASDLVGDAGLTELRKLRFSQPVPENFADCEAIFLAAPVGVAAEQARDLLGGGARLFDLSPDFRLQQLKDWEQWYQMPHPAPELVAKAVYGLPELHRDALADAALVAAPGCYSTAVILALAPLLQQKLLTGPLIADCASGVTGAGRKADTDYLFAEIAENYRAYGLAGHRHLPEMLEQLGQPELVFVPHLLPMQRGILATIHAEGGADDARDCLRQAYGDEPFVQVAEAGESICTAQVRGSNHCLLSVHRAIGVSGRIVIQAAIDNLLKGAGGQAVQCFNLAFGLDEGSGLGNPLKNR